MVQYVTRDELKSFARSKTLDEQARVRRTAANRSIEGATFLSHSSKDNDLVVGATIVLENHGGNIYIDEIDPEMPPYTTDETAALLKSRINKSHRFVVLTSQNSKESRWVPWELGVADGYKGMSKVAVFPSSDYENNIEWASWEYLGLYPRIAWGTIKGNEKPGWIVWDRRANTAVALRNWLA